MNTTLLVIGYVWPEPNSSAAGAHMLSLLRLFKRQQWRVIFASPAQKTEHMVDLESEGVESVEIQLNDSRFDDFVTSLSPDMVLFDRFMMEEQFAWRVEQACPEALRILDTEDLQCLRGARELAHKQQRSLSSADLCSDLAKREIAAILRCDLSLIISEYEMNLLKEFYRVEPAILHHLPFMLDLKKIGPITSNFDERKHFVTIGNFRHAPNWDSVLYLQQIWPLIRKQLPNVELHIYGSYPAKKATQLNNPKTGFLVKGWAENAFEVLAKAKVCLAPLRFGAGIKGKLIDAMQTGTPSVTTDIGSEGMCGDFAWPGLVANEAQAIADAAVKLYTSEGDWLTAQKHIQPLLAAHYDGEILGPKLIQRVAQIRGNLTQHRLNNFTGSMLNYHSLKSTKFMSKWIELKTQLNASGDN